MQTPDTIPWMHKPFSRNSKGSPDLAESLGHHWEDHHCLTRTQSTWATCAVWLILTEQNRPYFTAV